MSDPMPVVPYVDYLAIAEEEGVSPIRPAHYAVGQEHEAYKCLRAWGLENDAFLWTVGKYLSRAGKKDDLLQELKKMKWYLDNRIEQLEAQRIEPIFTNSPDFINPN